VTRPFTQVLEAKSLLADGLSLADVVRQLGIPRSTIRTWVTNQFAAPQRQPHPDGQCPHVERASANPTYAYLLGLYLGDGYIATHARGVYRLRVALDMRYPGIIAECHAAMAEVLPNRVLDVPLVGCAEVTSYSKHWTCLFPQHGTGPKHKRAILLEPWQRQIAIVQNPKRLLRGLIHSDGWRGLNVAVTSHGRYHYPRYQFSNRSDDIRAIFAEACAQVGVDCRPSNRWNLSVSRRRDVTRLDEFIGPKT
jgi:hypothetical protein